NEPFGALGGENRRREMHEKEELLRIPEPSEESRKPLVEKGQQRGLVPEREGGGREKHRSPKPSLPTTSQTDDGEAQGCDTEIGTLQQRKVAFEARAEAVCLRCRQ